jgi:hypothetical protein
MWTRPARASVRRDARRRKEIDVQPVRGDAHADDRRHTQAQRHEQRQRLHRPDALIQPQDDGIHEVEEALIGQRPQRIVAAKNLGSETLDEGERAQKTGEGGSVVATQAQHDIRCAGVHAGVKVRADEVGDEGDDDGGAQRRIEPAGAMDGVALPRHLLPLAGQLERLAIVDGIAADDEEAHHRRHAIARERQHCQRRLEQRAGVQRQRRRCADEEQEARVVQHDI